MKRKATKIVELVIADDSEELTIDAISLVTSPAIEQDFVFFGKENNNLTLAKVDEEKRMLVSPALIPNKQIFRYDPNTDSNYYVYFSKETVRQASELYLKHNNHHKATYQHEDRVSGVLTIESWIKEGEQDKSKLYGFDLPDGTWFVKMKIENDEMWNKIKDGELKGLSIEGYFINKMEKMGKQQFSNEDILEALSELIKEKTELKAEKVDLGVVQDLEKLLKDYQEEISDLATFKDLKSETKRLINLSSRVGKVKGTVDRINKIRKQIDGLQKKLSKAAKELGVGMGDMPVFKKLDKVGGQYNKQKSIIESAESISKILKV
jgi:methyl-accepting chemotaxis protein